ncbi:hypothetical protein BG015_005884 [Linnemannia schmuckeri]|uniref:Uncharacterized protein n=1 Tax=Linnemannia schmuckeri TaxID=64567 RepID=A0A9P5VCC7_9FUNG|nr:hypothetical protein BG015_005884 [Linnemannia schmuckeri]
MALRYWVQWGVTIEDIHGSFVGDYRVWISDKHKMMTNDPKKSEETLTLISRPQRGIVHELGRFGKERTLHLPKPRIPTWIVNKNGNNVDSTSSTTDSNNKERIDHYFSTRKPSFSDHAIVQLPQPLYIPLYCDDSDGDGNSGYENEKTTVTVMTGLPLGNAYASCGLAIEYVQLVPAGGGDPRAVEIEGEEEETESGISTIQR